jgi:hypothetical protein
MREEETMTRIINGVAYATDYEAIVGVEAGSGQHPVTRKVVTPGDVNFSDVNQETPPARRRADTGTVPTQAQAAQQAAPQQPQQPAAADGGR